MIGADGDGCLTGALGSVRSAIFRNRGIAASYTRQIGRLNAGVGAGYDRRTFLAAPGTVLAAADGTVDENYYITAFLQGPLGRDAGFAVNSYASWFESDFGIGNDVLALGTSASYRRRIIDGLSARAALAFDYIDSDITEDDLRTASALLGLRYDF